MAKRYFEYKDAKSKKFWEVSVSGKKVHIRYGKIGTDGQTSLKELSTPAEAKAHAEKQAAGTVKKGYKEAKVKAVKKAAKKKTIKKKTTKKVTKKKATNKKVEGKNKKNVMMIENQERLDSLFNIINFHRQNIEVDPVEEYIDTPDYEDTVFLYEQLECLRYVDSTIIYPYEIKFPKRAMDLLEILESNS